MAGQPSRRWVLIGGGVLAIALVALVAFPERKRVRAPVAVDNRSGLIPPGYQEGDGKYRLFDNKDNEEAATVGDGASAGSSPPAPPPAVAGKTIPDGSYDCRTWSGSSYIGLGTIRSAGNTLDTQLLAKVGATFTGVEATADGITVSYTSARGSRESMDCTRL